ncbi:hypothetical protein [Pseudosulfitobacter pseudonitzschiae]|uniref:hypothetical protein n=1 Tax=Pseudosulfitobacter pseudonitzschiae TaxID=1402135 RepID=UPI003B8073AD
MHQRTDIPLPDLTPLLIGLTGRQGLEKAFCKALLGSLSLNRVTALYLDRPERGNEPGPDDILSADTGLLKSVIQCSTKPQALFFNLGACSGNVLIEQILSEIETSQDQQRELDGGRMHAVIGSMSGRRDVADEDHSDTVTLLNCSLSNLCLYTIDRTVSGSLHRKNFVRLLNVVVLLEECGALFQSGSGKKDVLLRKDALENALMRILGSLSLMEDMDIDAIRGVFLMTGRASRLNLQISDALDRVDKYCHQAAADEDKADMARAVGRPFHESLQDIATAARQCRLYRDKILRQEI